MTGVKSEIGSVLALVSVVEGSILPLGGSFFRTNVAKISSALPVIWEVKPLSTCQRYLSTQKNED